MSYRIASDNDPENPNPHAWDLSAEFYETEQEAWDMIASVEEEETREYGTVWGACMVVHEPLPIEVTA